MHVQVVGTKRHTILHMLQCKAGRQARMQARMQAAPTPLAPLTLRHLSNASAAREYSIFSKNAFPQQQ